MLETILYALTGLSAFFTKFLAGSMIISKLLDVLRELFFGGPPKKKMTLETAPSYKSSRSLRRMRKSPEMDNDEVTVTLDRFIPDDYVVTQETDDEDDDDDDDDTSDDTNDIDNKDDDDDDDTSDDTNDIDNKEEDGDDDSVMQAKTRHWNNERQRIEGLYNLRTRKITTILLQHKAGSSCSDDSDHCCSERTVAAQGFDSARTRMIPKPSSKSTKKSPKSPKPLQKVLRLFKRPAKAPAPQVTFAQKTQ